MSGAMAPVQGRHRSPAVAAASESRPNSGRGWIVVLVGLLSLMTGCTLPQEVSRTPRSAIEQLLLSHAVHRALGELSLPIPAGESVALAVTGLQADRVTIHLEHEQNSGVLDGPAWDLSFVRDEVFGRLGELGYLARPRAADATYLIRVVVEALGTNQGQTFFGMPPIQSVLIPFSLPQLTLYQELDQRAHARLHLDIYEAATGRFIRSTPWLLGDAYHNQYTVLFFITWRTTDLIEAP